MNDYFAERPNLKDITKKAHSMRYNKILKFINLNNILLSAFKKQKKFLKVERINPECFLNKNFNNLIKFYIETHINLPSRGSYISTAMFVLSPKVNQPIPLFDDSYEEWKAFGIKVKFQYVGKQHEQKKNKKQSDKWLEWNVIIKLRNKLKKHFKNEKINNNCLKDWNKLNDLNDLEFFKKNIKNHFSKYQNYLILCLHTYIPPVRCEYGEMVVCKQEAYDRLPDVEKDNGVYLINGLKTRKLIMIGRYNRKILKEKNTLIDVPTEMNKIINVFMDLKFIIYGTKKTDFTPLLLGKGGRGKGTPLMSKNLYSKNFISMMVTFTNKKTSTTTMRSIFATHFRKGEKSIIEKNKICDIMNHSPSMQETNYVKKD
jgi:hypothetical protein